jgi:hypothetical protein
VYLETRRRLFCVSVLAAAVLPSFVRSVADAAVDQAAVLQPDPILRLAQVIGVSGTNAGSMLWSANGEEVIFPCANVVVVLNVAEDDSPASSNNTGLVSVNSSGALCPPRSGRLRVCEMVSPRPALELSRFVCSPRSDVGHGVVAFWRKIEQATLPASLSGPHR